MHSSKPRAGSSRTRQLNRLAEESQEHGNLRSKSSATEHSPEEVRQGEESPLIDETHRLQPGIRAMPVSVIVGTHSAVPLRALSIPSAVRGPATTSVSPEQSS